MQNTKSTISKAYSMAHVVVYNDEFRSYLSFKDSADIIKCKYRTGNIKEVVEQLQQSFTDTG